MGINGIIRLNGERIISPLEDHFSISYEVFKNMNTNEFPLNCRFYMFDMDSFMPELDFLPTPMIQNVGENVDVILEVTLPMFSGNTQAELHLISSVRKALIMENCAFKPELLMYSLPVKDYAFEIFIYKISLMHSSIQTVLTKAFKFNSRVEEKLERLFSQDLNGSCEEFIIPGSKEHSYKKINASKIVDNYFLADEE